MIRPLSVRGDCDGNTDDAEEHEDQSPPSEVWEAAANGGYYGADESNNPGKLYTRLATQPQQGSRSRDTDNADRNGSQREGIANYAAEAEGGPLAVAVSIFHFAQ